MLGPGPHQPLSKACVHWSKGRTRAEVECPGIKCLEEGALLTEDFELRGPSVQMVGMSQAAMEFAAFGVLFDMN